MSVHIYVSREMHTIYVCMACCTFMYNGTLAAEIAMMLLMTTMITGAICTNSGSNNGVHLFCIYTCTCMCVKSVVMLASISAPQLPSFTATFVL